MALHHIYIDEITGEMGWQGDLVFAMIGSNELRDLQYLSPKDRREWLLKNTNKQFKKELTAPK